MANELVSLSEEAIQSLKQLQTSQVDNSSAAHKSFMGHLATQKMASQLEVYLEGM